ncbi:hypothetical protein CTI12_AA017880 [Artemisia annua]|uniref:Uncharacterized protein n=1 Tax=Artemisia annua TaxID=35608 RepID=A0A2U1QIN0_ARTAN|nr:hypothetical protein CTI12_AA017880 [Artemisia annua]
MANETIERFLYNATRIIPKVTIIAVMFLFSIENININGLSVPVIYKDSPKVYGWALAFFWIATFTAVNSWLCSLLKSNFTKPGRNEICYDVCFTESSITD